MTLKMGSDLSAKVEAFLFARGEPIQPDELAKLFEVSREEIENALAELEAHYSGSRHGIILIRNNLEGVALGTSPEFGEILRQAFAKELQQELTPAALETLAIVAYRGPISRPEIDEIRGVNSAFMLRNLMIRGFIDRQPDPKRHNVWRYEVTLDCLKMLGVSKREELPDFRELSQPLNTFQSQPTQSSN
jgi:segregation and condensation protein B